MEFGKEDRAKQRDFPLSFERHQVKPWARMNMPRMKGREEQNKDCALREAGIRSAVSLETISQSPHPGI